MEALRSRRGLGVKDAGSGIRPITSQAAARLNLTSGSYVDEEGTPGGLESCTMSFRATDILAYIHLAKHDTASRTPVERVLGTYLANIRGSDDCNHS